MLTLQQILLLLGGWTIVLAAIFKFIGDNFATKLKVKWERESQQHINLLKGEIDRKNQLVSQILNSHSSSFQSNFTKKSDSFQTYWEIVVQIRKLNRGTETIYSFLIEDEIEKLYISNELGPSKVRKLFLEKISMEYGQVANEEADELRLTIEKSRPFIGEKLYNLYYLYSTFCMRATYLLIKDVDKMICTVWKKDSALMNSLKENLTEKEIAFLNSRNIDSYRLAVSILESKIISAISYCLTGEEAVDNSIAQAEKIEELMKLGSKVEYFG